MITEKRNKKVQKNAFTIEVIIQNSIKRQTNGGVRSRQKETMRHKEVEGKGNAKEGKRIRIKKSRELVKPTETLHSYLDANIGIRFRAGTSHIISHLFIIKFLRNINWLVWH